ncbi:MAG: hypothetical protein VX246_03500 [Myxococcota bacterium]|nr:hypothetical protein [Myxococcota bacterium]
MASIGLIVIAVAIRYGPLLASLGTSYADFEALHGSGLINELPDSRLNSWILAWVQRAAIHSPLSIFNGNIFHPAPNAITGSEHLFGIALQMAPFRLFTSNAIALHQIALVFSAMVLGLSSFAAVRGVTRSAWAGVLAALLAILMPWRTTEISHLQLTSAQFFPIIWWWALRSLDEDVPRRVSLGLAVCTAIQLLSSFYLAYFLTLSLGVLIAVCGFSTAERRRRLPRLASTLAPAYAVFGLTGLPYLAQRASETLEVAWDPMFSLGLEGAWHVIAPRWPHGEELGSALNGSAVYDIPYGAALLGILALALALRRTASVAAESAPLPSIARSASLAFAAIAFTGFVFAIGGSLEVAGTRVPLPFYYLTLVVPGFDMLRGPARWSILIGLSVPLLAGIGIAWLDARWRGGARWLSRMTVIAVVGLSLDLFVVPAAPAWRNPERLEARAQAIRALPDREAVIVELPVGHGFSAGVRGSKSVLASTLHWRRILNGYTGHTPPSYEFVRSLTRELPSRVAIDHLRRLTGVRWAVLDLAQTSAAELKAWDRADRSGRIRTHATVAGVRIVDLSPRPEDRSEASSWTNALIDPAPRTTTFAGLRRGALDLSAEAGRIQIHHDGAMFGAVDNPIAVRITNRSSQRWPGLDNQLEGLVLLRYTTAPLGASRDERAQATRLALLRHDIAPSTSARLQTFLRPPRPPATSPARLCVDLVQWLGGELRPLPVPPERSTILLRRRDDPSGLQKLIERYQIPPEPIPPCGTGHEPPARAE